MVWIEANATLTEADNRDGVRRLRPRPPVNPTQRQAHCLRELGDRQQRTDCGFFLGSHLNRVETCSGETLESFSAREKIFPRPLRCASLLPYKEIGRKFEPRTQFSDLLYGELPLPCQEHRNRALRSELWNQIPLCEVLLSNEQSHD